MDCATGRIGVGADLIKSGSKPGDLIPINMDDATARQRMLGQVSKHDHRSVLGMKFTRAQLKARRKRLAS